MTKAVAILILVGLLLLIGPTILTWILAFGALFEPNTSGTTLLLMVEVVANVVLAVMYKNAVATAKDLPRRSLEKQRRQKIIKIMTFVQKISIISVMLIFVNDLIVQVNNEWRWLVISSRSTFSSLFYIGLIMSVVGVSFFVIRGYLRKKAKAKRDASMFGWQKQPTRQDYYQQQAPQQPFSWQQPPQQQWYQRQVNYDVPEQTWYEVPKPKYRQGMAAWQMENMWEVEPPFQSQPETFDYRYPNYGKVVPFPVHGKVMVDEEDLVIHLPQSAKRKLML